MISKLLFSQYSSEELKRISTISIKNKNDVYSSSLGTGSDVYCSICKDPKACPGHLGYIELHIPIFNPIYIEYSKNIVNCICHKCYEVLDSNIRFKYSQDICKILSKIPMCSICNTLSMKYEISNNREFLVLKKDHSVVLKAQEAKQIFSKLSWENCGFLGFQKDLTPKNFVLDLIPVAPNCVLSKDEFIIKCYLKILALNKSLSDGDSETTKQKKVSSIYKEYANILGVNKALSENIRTLRQRLSGKSGTFRKISLGKRNKYCGRSVISPDPNLELDVVGVPRSFAKSMLFNYDTSSEHPKKRNMQDGDIILLNRQPSLQRMSLMGFRVKLVDNISTIQFNTSVCAAFNADFDGDEMNVFFPTNYVSRAEALELLGVKKCIISPQNGNPIIYPIQDCVLSLYMMTLDESIMPKALFNNCIAACSMLPCILQAGSRKHLPDTPCKRTGKRLISCAIPELFDYSDDNVLIKSGEIISGKIVNSSLKNIIKCMYYICGEENTVFFINNIQLMANTWLLAKGFSVGYQDCVVENLDEKISSKLSEESERIEKISDKDEYILNIEINNIRNISQKICVDIVSKNSRNEEVPPRPAGREGKDAQTNSILQMVNSGAKGSMTNFCQIVALLGQQNVRGKRPEKLLSKNTRTIPHFKPGDNSLEALGFCFSSYSKGLSPTEYFFHCQGARDGLINTGVKTSKTGYIQRKICKSLEDIKECYDGTVRLGDKIIQFEYR